MNGIPAQTKPRECREERSRPASVRLRARSVGFVGAGYEMLEFDLPPNWYPVAASCGRGALCSPVPAGRD